MSTLLLMLKRTALMCESATCFVASKLGARDARPPGVEILSYSCSFRQKNLQNIRLAHRLWELALPTQENPGLTTDQFHKMPL